MCVREREKERKRESSRKRGGGGGGVKMSEDRKLAFIGELLKKQKIIWLKDERERKKGVGFG